MDKDQRMDIDALQKLRREVEEVVREASSIMLEAEDQAEQSEQKSNRSDLVTVYDVRVQEYLERELLRILPDAGFVGEEEDTADIDGKQYYYIVDPIDGTLNFVRDFRHSGISVALAEAGEDRPRVVLGVCFNPYLDEMFTAILGDGAKLNNEPISVIERPLEDSVVLFGTSPYYREYADQTFAMAKEFYKRGSDVRRVGAAVLDICYVAVGRGDLFYELELSPWDYAAASLIVQEAGAVATDMDGQPLSMTTKSGVLVGSPAHHAAALELYKEVFEGVPLS